jgi:hypothetical protein
MTPLPLHSPARRSPRRPDGPKRQAVLGRVVGWLPLVAALLLPMLPMALVSMLAPRASAAGMTSPWWEDYAVKTRYICPDKNQLVVERNDAQASLITGRFRTTLFRETSDLPGLRYKADDIRLILRGDELTLEQLPMRLQCLRTEEV